MNRSELLKLAAARITLSKFADYTQDPGGQLLVEQGLTPNGMAATTTPKPGFNWQSMLMPMMASMTLGPLLSKLFAGPDRMGLAQDAYTQMRQRDMQDANSNAWEV